MNKVSTVCKRKKNGAIEFYRFLFSCIIYVLHFRGYGNFEKGDGVFYGGYLAVEFFFIVSGALSFKGLNDVLVRSRRSFLRCVIFSRDTSAFYRYIIVLCYLSLWQTRF